MGVLDRRRRLFYWLWAVLLGLWQCAFAAQAEELVFVCDEAPYCPYTNCGQGRDGFAIDMVKAIYAAQGYRVKIEYLPWSRALERVNKGSVDGIVNVLKKSAPGLVYPKTEVAQYAPVVFALKNNPWRYEGVESFKSVRLGLIQGYGYGDDRPEFARYLETHAHNIEWVSGTDPLLRIFKMLELGRVDATMEDLAVANYVLLQAGMHDKLRIAGPFGATKVNAFVGFPAGKPRSQRLAEIFDQGLQDLRSSQRLQALLAPYGLTDWKKAPPRR